MYQELHQITNSGKHCCVSATSHSSMLFFTNVRAWNYMVVFGCFFTEDFISKIST